MIFYRCDTDLCMFTNTEIFYQRLLCLHMTTKKPRYKSDKPSTDLDLTEFRTRLGVVGYRDYHDYQHIKKELDYFNSRRKIDLIVSGGCSGVDTLGERWADENNVPKKILKPDLSHGKRGYAIRDQLIVDSSTHLIAFPSIKGTGTQLTIEMAKKKEGLKLKVIQVN